MSDPLKPASVGAAWSSDDGPVVPRSYGDPASEYRAGCGSAVVIDRCDRSILRLHGRDPQRILQGILSNDVTLASAEQAVYAAMLTPKGRMLADVRVFRRGDDFLLDVPTAALPTVFENFRRTIPPLFARWEDVSASEHIVGVYGPQAGVRLAALLGAQLPPADIENAAAVIPVGQDVALAVCTRITGGQGYDVVLPRAAAEVLWQELTTAGVLPAGHAALDVLRIEAGVPHWGAELAADTIPLEAGLQARAISTTKGCYTGQEVIVRILHRGHVNWLLRGVLLGEAAGVRRGTSLVAETGGKQLGRVTSCAWSPRLDQEIALAYVRREVEPGAVLQVEGGGGGAATVVALPFAT